MLDLGCGDGGKADLFRKYGNEAVGVDFTGLIEVARKQYPEVKFLVANLEEPFTWADDGEFTVIHAGDIIEHIVNIQQFVEECRRVLSDKGRIIVTTPNAVSIKNRLFTLAGMGAHPWWEVEADTHIHFFTHETLQLYMEHYGFRTTHLIGLGDPEKWMAHIGMAGWVREIGENLIAMLKERGVIVTLYDGILYVGEKSDHTGVV